MSEKSIVQEARHVAGVYLCRQRTGAGCCCLSVPDDDDGGGDAQPLIVLVTAVGAANAQAQCGADFFNHQEAGASQPFLVSNLSN